jgi:hypothetical protein
MKIILFCCRRETGIYNSLYIEENIIFSRLNPDTLVPRKIVWINSHLESEASGLKRLDFIQNLVQFELFISITLS